MAIDIGDAVLTFLGDTTQLDTAFNKVATDTGTKIQPAADAIQKMAGNWQFAGQTASTALKSTSDGVTGLSGDLAVGQQGAVKLGEVLNLAGEKSTESMYQARGEMMLIDELIGIRLPRHVVSFLAEIPGLGAALSSAFAATAVIFLVEALVKGVGKLSEWVAETFIFTESQRAANAVLLDSNKAIADYVKKVDELQKEFQLIGLTGSARLLQEGLFKADDAKKAELQLNDISNEVYALRNGMVTLPEAIAVANQAIHSLHQGKSEKDLKNLLLPTDADKADVITALQSLQAELLAKKHDFDQQLANLSQKEIVDQQKEDAAAAQARIEAQKKTGDAQVAVELQQALQRNTQLKTSYLEDAAAKQQANEKKYQNDLAALQAQRALNNQLQQDEVNRLQAARALYEKDPTRNAANIQATDDEILRVAAQFTVKRIQLDGEIVAAERNHQAEQLAQMTKFLELRRTVVERNQRDLEKEMYAGMVQGYLDEERLSVQNLKVQEDNDKALMAEKTEKASEQEKAIAALASFHILTETEKAHRLSLLYKQEEDELLKILKNTLKLEEENLLKANVNLIAAKANPWITPEQVKQLEAFLAEAEKAVARTNAQIANTTKEFQNKQLAADKTHYGAALALAIVAGNKELEQKLKNNHADLLAAQAQLAEAGSRRTNTATIKAQIKALQKLEKENIKDAHDGLKAWQQFGAGFRQDAQADQKTMQQMGEEMRKDLQSFSADLGAEFAAMIQGQESFGEAMAHATEKLIGKMAQQWGEFYAARAIADLFDNPAKAAAEFAAATALFTLGSLLSSLGGSGGSSGGASSGTGSQIDRSSSVNQPAQNPVQTLNVVHLASGALVTAPTLALVGDSQGGGSGREAVLPLDNAGAMKAIASALGEQMRMGGGGGDIYITIEPGMNTTKLVHKISRDVNRGKVYLRSSDSLGYTPRRGFNR